MDPGLGSAPGDRLLRVTHTGEVCCRRHGKPVEFQRLERANRDGLEPGVEGDPRRLSKFRWRGICRHDRTVAGDLLAPCGELSLPATIDEDVDDRDKIGFWRRLGHFPHHKLGKPDRHAFREVVLRARMGQVESFFQAIKAGHLLLGAGAGRSRVNDRMYYEALVALACLFRAALTVYDQRVRAGLIPEEPEPYVPRRQIVLPAGVEADQPVQPEEDVTDDDGEGDLPPAAVRPGRVGADDRSAVAEAVGAAGAFVTAPPRRKPTARRASAGRKPTIRRKGHLTVIPGGRS